MTVTHVVGVDPGLVHTGVVRLVFEPAVKEILVEHEAIAGPDAKATADFALGHPEHGTPHVYIEKYQPRSHLNADAKMAEAMVNMKRALPSATVVLNTGVKKVVRKHLMELLGVWKFSTPTNHQDLRSAARIALYGMLKDGQMNRLLSDVVRDHLKGRPWDVRS